MTVTNRVFTFLTLATVTAIAACGGGQPPEPPAPAVDTQALRIAREDSLRRADQARESAAAEALRRARQDSIDRANAEMETARRNSEMLRGTVMAGINFDFDRSELRDDAKAALDAKIPILMANSGVTIRVSGHADERGSSEYNLALGQRRAAAAKRYLVERGIAEGRIETISQGEERPLCTESSENCWAQNRRDEFEITAGGPTLTAPRN
jgi:peptidoglycan-associated lipoprotein